MLILEILWGSLNIPLNALNRLTKINWLVLLRNFLNLLLITKKIKLRIIVTLYFLSILSRSFGVYLLSLLLFFSIKLLVSYFILRFWSAENWLRSKFVNEQISSWLLFTLHNTLCLYLILKFWWLCQSRVSFNRLRIYSIDLCRIHWILFLCNHKLCWNDLWLGCNRVTDASERFLLSSRLLRLCRLSGSLTHQQAIILDMCFFLSFNTL